jgi:hypothetical protein
MALVADTGQCAFTLNNMAAGARPQGYYSPAHANVRTGWTYGVPLRVVFTGSFSTVFAGVGITRSSTTATATTLAVHGRSVGDWVTIAGAAQSEYNGTFQIATVPTTTTFTYTVAGSPATPATGTITAVQSFVKFRGKVRVIDPTPGRYSTQQVHVVAYDIINDLAETDLRSVSTQQNKTEAELFQEVLDSLPAEVQPVAVDIDTGVDTFSWAFDDIGGGTKALTAIDNVARSAFALVTAKGDGTLVTVSRHSRTTGTSLFTLDDNSMRGFSMPSSLDGVYNLVRVTTHPKLVDAAATTALYAHAGAGLLVPANSSIEVWGSYTDPVDRQTPIGGVAGSFVDPPTSTTDFTANAAADGSGANRTSDMTLTLAPFSSSCKFTIANTSATDFYATSFQVRGKGIYDQSPQTSQASSTQTYGVRPLSILLPYQDDPGVAQSAATFMEAQYRSVVSQPVSAMFQGSISDTMMQAALSVEPGNLVTVSETMTGTASVEVVVQSIDLSVTPGVQIVCRWGLAPASPWRFWRLGITGASELGVSTVLGF